ncbi:MAG: hypothetical protein ACOX47_06740 [Bacillota bacterium]
MTTKKRVVPDPDSVLSERLRNMVMEFAEDNTIYGPDNFPISRMDMETRDELTETKKKPKKK